MAAEIEQEADLIVSLVGVAPDPQALRRMQPYEAHAWRVLPLGWENGRLLVASDLPVDQRRRILLSRVAGWSVLPLQCLTVELDLALDKYYGHAAPSRAALRPVDPLALLRALDILPDSVVRQALGQQTRTGRGWLNWLVGRDLLDDEAATALIAVQHNRPHLRRARFPIPDGLTLLAPPLLAARWNAVPFYADASRLWVYVPADKPLGLPDELSRAVGLDVLPVLITRAEWERVYLHSYKEAVVTPEPVRSADEVLLAGNWLAEGQKRQVREVQKRNGFSIAAQVRAKGWLLPEEWQTVEAQRYGLLPPLDSDAESLRDLRYAATFARSWNIVPLALQDGALHVGLSQATMRRYLPAVAVVTRLDVAGHLLNEEQFERAWKRYFGRDGANRQNAVPSPALDEWLLAGGYLSPEQLEQALEHGREHDLGLDASLDALGLIDATDRAEILSLQSGMPWFPMSQQPRQLPPSQRSRLKLDPTLVALLDLGHAAGAPTSILAAVADPYALVAEGDGSAAFRLQPLIVPQSALNLTAATVGARYSNVDEFLRYAVQRQQLRPEGVPGIVERVNSDRQPLDLALASEVREPQNVARLLAGFSRLPLVSLAPAYSQEMLVDALGKVRRRTTVEDPVLVSRDYISVAETRHWAAIPLKEDAGRLTIAIADPLNELARTTIELSVAPLRVSWVVAPRQEILDSIARKLGRKNIGTYLLEAGIISADALSAALELSQRVGIRVGRALVLLGYTTQEELVTMLAAQQGLTYLDLEPAMIEPEIAKLLPEREARQWGALPVGVDGDTATVALVDPLNTTALAAVERALGKRVVPAITTEDAFETALEYLYNSDYTYRSTQELIYRRPEESAFRVLTRNQKITLVATLIVSAILLVWNPVAFLITFNAITTAFYLGFSAHRFYLVYRALSNDLEVPVSAAEMAALKDQELPVYTILIPVYKEAAVLPKVMRSITSLDYPLAKLDVKILMEANDRETIEAAERLNLPLNFEHVIVPDSLPKTKPKACNYGLIKARGEYVVIYDAEDIPDPDQLKKAFIAFGKAGPDVACIQAKLNYFNRDQNLLTRWFTNEYSMWFDLFLPGLDASGAPVPLGGTSNHFRRNLLESLGAWDPFNVTEDADLGVRLYKAGYTTAMIDSTTFEEANSDLANWIRQRSRWVKGYIQTWLVHMRHPVAFLKEIGFKGFMGFNLTVGGTFLGFLLNPVYWLLTTLWFLTSWGFILQIFPTWIYYIGALNLFIGNFAFTYMNLAGSLRRGFYDMVRYALLSPIYWVLMSIGAWKGFIQLIHKPFYWEKTIHGLDKSGTH